MEVPKCCRQCRYNRSCMAYYGGSLCRFKKEINAETNRKFREGK